MVRCNRTHCVNVCWINRHNDMLWIAIERWYWNIKNPSFILSTKQSAKACHFFAVFILKLPVKKEKFLLLMLECLDLMASVCRFVRRRSDEYTHNIGFYFSSHSFRINDNNWKNIWMNERVCVEKHFGLPQSDWLITCWYCWGGLTAEKLMKFIHGKFQISPNQ